MGAGHIWPEQQGDVWLARLETGDTADTADTLTYERLEEPLGALSRADAFLVGSLLIFMSRRPETVRVHGPVSRTLLRNLEEFQDVWTKWCPDLYSRVAIEADEVIDDAPTGEGAISGYSGGVDASFTVYRHAVANDGWHALPLREVVMVQGMDIGLDEPEVFASAVARGRKMLDGTGLTISQVRTNLHELAFDWFHSFAVCVASVLHLFADRRATGLIASSEDYADFVRPNGSSPVHDWMSSSGALAIRHDGAGYSRTEKIRALANWPAATEFLRVCYRGENHDRNCGRCEKCVRTMLNFRLAGGVTPRCFESDVVLADIKKVYFANGSMRAEWESLLAEAERQELDAPWVREVRSMVRRERMKETPPGRLIKRARESRRSARS